MQSTRPKKREEENFEEIATMSDNQGANSPTNPPAEAAAAAAPAADDTWNSDRPASRDGYDPRSLIKRSEISLSLIRKDES